MKTQTRWDGLQKVGRVLVRQMVTNVGTVVLALALLLMADFVGAAPWSTATQSPAGDGEFTMPYQGRLTDAFGNPINNTAPGLEMTFALYTQETDGAPVWSEHHSGVPVSDGLFNVYLGSITPLESALFDNDLWLGVKVGIDSEMVPREKLTAVWYAMRAGQALEAETVLDGSITNPKLAKDAVTSAKIANGAVSTSDLAKNAVTSAKIADGAVSTSDLAKNAVTSAKIAGGAVSTSDLANGAVTQAKAPRLAAAPWNNRLVVVLTWVGNTNGSGIATIDISSYGFSHIDGVVAVNGDDNAHAGGLFNVYDWNTSRVRVRAWGSNGNLIKNLAVRVNLAIMGKH